MRAVYRFWLQARGDAVAPSMKTIDPHKLPPSALPYVVIYEVEHEPMRFRVRLVGTAVVQEIGEDDTGTSIDQKPGFEKQSERFRRCVRERRPYVATDTIGWASRDYRTYTVLAMPFLDADDRVSRLMFVFTFA